MEKINVLLINKKIPSTKMKVFCIYQIVCSKWTYGQTNFLQS